MIDKLERIDKVKPTPIETEWKKHTRSVTNIRKMQIMDKRRHSERNFINIESISTVKNVCNVKHNICIICRNYNCDGSNHINNAKNMLRNNYPLSVPEASENFEYNLQNLFHPVYEHDSRKNLFGESVPHININKKQTSSIFSGLKNYSEDLFKHKFLIKSSKKNSFIMWKSFNTKMFNYLVNLIILFVLLNLLLSMMLREAYGATNVNKFSRFNRIGKTCRSQDLRNHPDMLNDLQECSVIEGFLIVSLMNHYEAHHFENKTFPLLTEVTDYVMIYRVNGLRSLGKLFPNLTVIRGNQLFEGYALVIFENQNLEEIGLYSLTHIKRGGVRIEKNPALCFVNTVDWTRIVQNSSLENHFIKDNKLINQCPSCPGGVTKLKSKPVDILMDQIENVECPVLPGEVRHCWNRKHCQKICPRECGNNHCNNNLECCHESCLGSCSTNNTSVCTVCKHLTLEQNNERKCLDKCPSNLYKYTDRRCVTAKECRNLPKQLRNHEYPYVPFQEECVSTCPAGFEKKNNETCVPCKGKCIKKCQATAIDTVSDARKLKGCTIITGELIISIRGGGPHLIDDLESSLSSIEEIEGYLKVTRSHPLTSLVFLKRLRVIKGNNLEGNKYALYILDNQNLQNIWGENQTVIIEKGRVFFHFNPKLCYYKIENLKPMIMDNNTFDKAEVAIDSNGDRVGCNITILNVTITNIVSKAAIVKLEPMFFEDERVLLGYRYYHMPAPYQNVTIYEGRHGCGYDAWNVADDTSKEQTHIFTHLKPYTQYAFYVKTYTVASEQSGGQSPIQYFRTLPDKPEPVRNLIAYSNGSSEIVVKWREPRVANGNLTEYIIKANISYDDSKILEERNYCKEPIKQIFDQPSIIAEIPKKESEIEKDDKDCLCENKDIYDDETKAGLLEESIAENAIDFEDAVHNFVYVKREDQVEMQMSRRRRDTNTLNNDKKFPTKDSSFLTSNDDSVISQKEGKYFTYVHRVVNASVKTVVLKELKHYTSYTISVKACREGSGDNCSNEGLSNARTLKLSGADDVQNLNVKVIVANNTHNVRLTWDPPELANSLIVSYSIKYYRVDIEHAKHIDKCITQKEYEKLSGGYLLTDFETGNYSIQVMGTSLAGDGNYSQPQYFYIEENGMSIEIILLICFGFLIFGIAICISIWQYRKRCLPVQPDLKLFTSVNPEYISMQYTPDEWEIPREKIIQLRELGQGSFGMVYEGIIKNLNNSGEDTPCAIKTVNESATDRERINFLKEAGIMKAFDTYHVVRLFGVVSRGQPVLVIMELMTNGDLKGYLRSHRPEVRESANANIDANTEDGTTDLTTDRIKNVQLEEFRDDNLSDPTINTNNDINEVEQTPQPPSLKRILQMAIEIADGMAYLSAKKYVHRDLAARNCMVAGDLTVKIGDFGMTRDIYETDYYRKGTKGLLPVRWMAPESLKDGVFTSSSDVFSYGVVLWEMATLASQPYQGLSNDQVLRYVIDGGVMERPENCPDKLYNLMRRCWQHRPSSRPKFMEIIQYLLDDADPTFKQVSFYHCPQGREILEQMQPTTDIDDVTTPFRTGDDETTPLRADDDDFKINVDDNFSVDPTGSHLVPDKTPHSPYRILTEFRNNSSLDDGASKRYNQDNKAVKNKQLAASTVQSNNSNIVHPRFRRMEFFCNAFLGNSNGNNNRNSSNGTRSSTYVDCDGDGEHLNEQRNSMVRGFFKKNGLFKTNISNGSNTQQRFEKINQNNEQQSKRYTKYPILQNLEQFSIPLPLNKRTQNQCNTNYESKLNNSNLSINNSNDIKLLPYQKHLSPANGYLLASNEQWQRPLQNRTVSSELFKKSTTKNITF